MSLASLVIECGKPYPPGTYVDLHFQSACKATFPVVGADKVTLPSEPTFANAETWLTAKILIDTGSIQWAAVGEVGGQGIQSSFNFFVPGDDAEQLAFAVCVVENSGNLTMGLVRRTDKNRIIGTDKLPAYVETLDGNSQAKLGEGKVGTAYKVTYPGPPLEFAGEFTITSGP